MGDYESGWEPIIYQEIADAITRGDLRVLVSDHYVDGGPLLIQLPPTDDQPDRGRRVVALRVFSTLWPGNGGFPPDPYAPEDQ